MLLKHCFFVEEMKLIAPAGSTVFVFEGSERELTIHVLEKLLEIESDDADYLRNMIEELKREEPRQ